MTATAARVQASGLDRIVMKLSLSMLRWARKRAARASIAAEQHARLVRQAADVQLREHESALRAARVI